MKKLIFTILLTTLAVFSINAGLVQQADSAYKGQNYGQALKLYTAAKDSLGPSATLYYNIGNCYYRLNRPGKAIVNYERALRLDPLHDEAATNLEFVNSKLTDRPGERGTFIGNVLDSSANAVGSDGWAMIAVLCFIFTVGAILLYIFTSNIMLRKVGFFGGGLMILLCVLAVFFSFRSAAIALSDHTAVVIEASTILSTSPRQPANAQEEALVLHEGARMNVLDSVTVKTDSTSTTWLDVEIDNQHRAWINAKSVERI